MNPLEGIRIIDLTSAIAGSFGTMILADLGAEVIKIEPPKGEHYRHAMDGAILLAMNRNKRGIALDLTTKEGQEVTLKLVKTADVFMENFVPGTIEKLGLDYKRVKEVNPRIIYCSVSGYGQTGPYSRRPSYDPAIEAMSGIMIATGEEKGAPVRQVTSFIDMTASLYAITAILAALWERQKTGEGQYIDVSLLDTGISAMSYYITHYSFTGKLPSRAGSGHTAWTPYQLFETRDRPLWIGISTDKFWQAFCKALELNELGNDPRYSTAEGRRQHREELVQKVSQICQQYTCEELEAKLVAAGVPCGRLLNVAEACDDPHVKQRQIIEELDYPGIGRIKLVRTPIMYSGKLPETKLRPPLLGEHTTQVLLESGFSEEEIHQLIEKGIAIQYTPQERRD